MKTKFLFLILIIASGISGVAVADPIKCPSSTAADAHLKYVGYRESDGYITFALTEKSGDLEANTEYWLSNYTVDKDWAKAAYAAALAAITTGSKVWINCNGTTANQIYVYNE